MVRLDLIVPVVRQLNREGIDATATLAALGLTPAQLQDTEAFVTAAVMYQLVESLCGISDDPYIAVRAGESMNPLKFRPLASASQFADTLFELLFLFTLDTPDSASSVEHSIHARSLRTTFRADRYSDYGIKPRHNDAFTIGYLLAMMRPIIGKSWDGSRILLSLCDPDLLPEKYLGCRRAKSDALGVSIDFPTDWLQLSRGRGPSHPPGRRKTRETVQKLDTLSAFRKMVSSHLNETDLTLQKVAGMFKVSPSTLKRRLSDHHTTLGNELAQLRKQRALEMLEETDYPISAIASELGFSDASVFARSFRRWTGLSPSQARRHE